MALPKTPLLAALMRFAGGLRFKNLFLLTGALFLIDLIIPDVVPFADEVILGLLTLLFSTWKKRGEDNLADEDYIDGKVVDRDESTS